MEKPVEMINSIKDMRDFLVFVTELAEDAKRHPDEWANQTISDYLEQLASWVEDMSQVDNKTDWDKLDYKSFAKMLYMGKIYE